jgi:hypothetical protein
VQTSPKARPFLIKISDISLMQIKKNNIKNIFTSLQSSSSEEEVRLRILDGLGISKKLKVIGNTDGLFQNYLFEFKFDKKFYVKGAWRKSAYGVLAQGLYYCRKILNFEVEGVKSLPHSIIFCDKNGGFIVPTQTFEWILQFDPVSLDEFDESQIESDYHKYYKYLHEGGFNWESPPSSQNPLLTSVLMEIEALKNIKLRFPKISGES